MEPIFVDRLPDTPAHVVIAQFPKGWVGQWHENPAPQWIIPLSGRWFVETMDGHRVEMGPGDASLGEDQGSKPDAAGRAGHLSGTLGEAEVANPDEWVKFVQQAWFYNDANPPWRDCATRARCEGCCMNGVSFL